MTAATAIDLTAIADQLNAAGVTLLWSGDAAKKAIADGFTGGLNWDQCLELSRILHLREVRAATEAFKTTQAIRTHILAAVNSGAPGVNKPEKADLRWMAKMSNSTTDQFGRARQPYQAAEGCQLRLKLSEGVRYSHTQESYSDDSLTAVPVIGEVPTDPAARRICETNLSRFVRYSDTHTGLAGSGCNYKASLVTNEHGALAIIYCRASIAD